MFQSRSGFLRRCNRAMCARGPGSTRFNPVLGFYVVATRLSDRPTALGRWFQSRSGFLRRCNWAENNGKTGIHMFQSRSGFLRRCNMSRTTCSVSSSSPFQSRSGFLRRCNSEHARSRWDQRAFQSRSGFLRRCNNQYQKRLWTRTLVSIPFWVSTSLQPPTEDERVPADLRFQSRSGFLRRCNTASSETKTSRRSFNPVLGFYVVATSIIPPWLLNVWFQSRSGFLRRCNRRLPTTSPKGPSSFNPVLGFYVVATGGSETRIAPVSFFPPARSDLRFMDPLCTRLS